MNNNETLNEFFVWEENNSTGLNQNSLKNAEKDKCVITTETKTNVENLHWKDITDPKLRRKMRKKVTDRARYLANKDKLNAQSKAWHKSNKDKIKAYYITNKDKRKAYYITNKDKRKDYLNLKVNKDKRKAYYLANKDKIMKNMNNRRKTDIQYKITTRLRVRLCHALKNNQKSGSAVRDLGCSIEELKQHLESKFQPGMSWDNWTINGWHIDHIKPLASFDLTDRNQLLEACHYTNLQPLWANDNLAKSDKIIPQSV